MAISHTIPAHAGREAVHEIEALYLAMIAATRRTLYVESQYFASRTLAEEKAMGSARALLLVLVGTADIHDRFRLYTPVASAGTPIYVHAKIVIMDDTLMRVVSSNLNTRSLGFDTECDLSVETVPGGTGEDAIRMKITGFGISLLAEHLDVETQRVAQTIHAANGSLIGAIEALRGSGRSLVPFEPPEFGVIGDDILRENDLLDPERPARRWPFS